MPQPSYLNVISQGCYNILTRQNISWTTRLPNAGRTGVANIIYENQGHLLGFLFILNDPKECCIGFNLVLSSWLGCENGRYLNVLWLVWKHLNITVTLLDTKSFQDVRLFLWCLLCAFQDSSVPSMRHGSVGGRLRGNCNELSSAVSWARASGNCVILIPCVNLDCNDNLGPQSRNSTDNNKGRRYHNLEWVYRNVGDICKWKYHYQMRQPGNRRYTGP